MTVSRKGLHRKGSRLEYGLRDALQAIGVSCKRVPLSGGGSIKGDVLAHILGAERSFECKVRANGFAQLYSWLTDNWAVVCRADRHDPLVVMRLADWVQLVERAEDLMSAEAAE